MKLLAYGLILMTLLFSIQAMEQQISGRADVLTPGRSYSRNTADKETKPEEYRILMTYQWIRAVLPGAAGLFLLHLIRRGERLDPFSPHFQGSAEIDKLSDYLDETKKRER